MDVSQDDITHDSIDQNPDDKKQVGSGETTQNSPPIPKVEITDISPSVDKVSPPQVKASEASNTQQSLQVPSYRVTTPPPTSQVDNKLLNDINDSTQNASNQVILFIYRRKN